MTRAALLDVSPLWPADLHHIRIDSPDPARLAAFYARAMGMTATPLGDDTYRVEGRERRLVIGRGAARAHPYSAFALADSAQLERYRRFATARGATLLSSPTPLFAAGAFAVRDPDERLAVFGVPHGDTVRPTVAAAAAALPGRLQHVVVASSRFPAMMAFYRDVLGFLVSDTVHVDDGKRGLGDVNVCFLRANEEHHSFAVFRAPVSASDHFACETASWDDIRRWADHFAALDVAIWWGPGRHGAGNNLFFMVKDPDGNNIELSAELERLAKGEPGKRWPAGGKALNLWGPIWVRDTAAD
jgi:catechol 2,3-dioxygenase-like lactoylglutathione lyase family enzyme